MNSMNEDTEDIWEEDLEADLPAEPSVRLQITAEKGQELMRIDKFLMNRIEGATRNKIQQALDAGHIVVNSKIVKPNYRVRPLDQILVFETRSPETTEIIPENIPLQIIYEDETLLVIQKPAGMVVHPGCGNYSGTLVNAVAWHLKDEQADPAGLPRVGLVHRIDKDTSGLVVVAKTEQAMNDLNGQFKKHTVHRRYLALAWGDLEASSGTIEAHIGRNLRFRKIMDAFPEGDHGKHAITHYSVIERFNYVTLLELRLETGRTHQIRVHMKYIGHPLFNDATYGGDKILKGTIYAKYKQFVENCFALLPRQALHAKELGFRHPATGEWMQFDSELPSDLKQVIEKWRSYTGGKTGSFPG